MRGYSNLLTPFWLAISACVILCSVDPLVAQQAPSRFKVANTSSPRDTLRSFIEACNEINERIHGDGFFDRRNTSHDRLLNNVIDCIDLSEVPDYAREYRATEIAVCLKEVLDRIEIPDWELIPDTSTIEAAGGLEKLSIWRIPESRITISRIESGPQKHEYLFSSGTAQRAISYYEQIRDEPYRTDGLPVSKNLYSWYFTVPGDRRMAAIVRMLPEKLQRGRSYGLANWKWPGLILGLVVALGIMAIAFKLQWRLTEPARRKGRYWYCLTIVFPVIAMLIPLAFETYIENFLTVRGMPLYLLSFLANLLVILIAMVVVFAAANRVAESTIDSPRINSMGLNAQLIRISAKIVSIIGAMMLFIVGGQHLGVEMSTLMASAGIFGAAIALAAQDVIKGVFGTLTLLSDKPFRVGERIMFEKYDGVIEDIGLRSTRMRLLTGSLVTLPNDRLAGNDVENLTNRKHLRRQTFIHLPLTSTLEQIDNAVAIVRKELENHEGMDPAFPPRVFFDEFESDAFTIRVFYWYSPPNFWEFKKFGEAFNFSIFKQFEAAGIQFSIPSRHSLWQSDSQPGALGIRMVTDQEDEK